MRRVLNFDSAILFHPVEIDKEVGEFVDFFLDICVHHQNTDRLFPAVKVLTLEYMESRHEQGFRWGLFLWHHF